MRIVGGRLANRTLTSPSGRVRPTSEDLRAALMALVGTDLEQARVVDLFAGSGALGLEALSRGALSADFVENDPAALHALKANVAGLRLTERARIFKRDAIPFVERLTVGAYDIAFVDPPYGSRKLDRVLTHWRVEPFAALLLIEHAADRDVPEGGVSCRVGDSVATLYRSA